MPHDGHHSHDLPPDGWKHTGVRVIPGVKRAKTELVWDPPWTRERLSLEAQLELGLL